jgi:hypothetical protein
MVLSRIEGLPNLGVIAVMDGQEEQPHPNAVRQRTAPLETHGPQNARSSGSSLKECV